MRLAVLVSGGLDSAILLATSLHDRADVIPLYVRQGLAWEDDERRHLTRFLNAVRTPALAPLQILDMPANDLYGRHWSVTGKDVPGPDTPDDAVFLPGRNVFLLAKPLLWCHLRGVPELALGILRANPFPDATPRFLDALQDVVNQAVQGQVRIVRPFARLGKREVMLLGKNLPLELTFSCIRPQHGIHCGRCNKCAERQHAFADAGLTDRTPYA